jgi:hypothetical protein
MKLFISRPSVFFLLYFFMVTGPIFTQKTEPSQIIRAQKTFPLYPETLEALPAIPSPYKTEDGVEVVLAVLKDGSCALIPVTVENGAPLHYSKRIQSLYGKDQQLHVDAGNFPALARTGLHSATELEKIERITDIPVSLITTIGRPGGFSYAGFMASDEDIVSILKGDNRLVKSLGLTHPDLARPLFHVWNIILKEIELGRLGRFWGNIPFFHYNGHQISLKAAATKGWQISIFQDEIQGRHDIGIRRELSSEEKAFLEERYSRLSDGQISEMMTKLSAINFSEMAPYYIQYYGFYEGHTAYRTDPIAIAFVFGLKTLEEIEKAFEGHLFEVLTGHFTEDTV